MGLFVHTAIILNSSIETVRSAVEQVALMPDMDLVPAECQYQQQGSGVMILFNEYCCGYGDLAEALSSTVKRPVMLLYLYDEDYWGYYFYEDGRELDVFSPIPDYFDTVSEQERIRLAGNSAVISQYFQVAEESIQHYLVPWSAQDMEAGVKAYAGDTFCLGDCWQMADFMNKIDYPYQW